MSQAEILGLIATTFVLLSFLMKRTWKIRVINIIGAAFFVVYGLIIDAWSVWLLNALLIIIHLCFLISMKRKPKQSVSKSGKLSHFQAGMFNQKAFRKSSWFLTARGDRLTDW